VEAATLAGPSWRGLAGGRFGAAAPLVQLPTDSPGVKRVEPNLYRHHAMFAAVEQPGRCTIVLAYLPAFEGSDDTAAVRRIVESVRLGPDAPTPDFIPPDSVASLAEDADSSAGESADSAWADSDRGIGLVVFSDTVGVDTLTVRESPDASSPVVARVARDREARMTFDGPAGVAPSSVEYAYEVSGIPVLEVGRDTTWLRVQYGEDTTTRAVRAGWVRLVPGRVLYRPWVDLIFERGGSVLFGRVPRAPYRASPDGPPVPPALVEAGGGAALVPEAVRGDWMLVRARTPNDECDTAAARVRETLVWIRFLDGRRRPLVFYPPRGC
jgi:hypothetical protein